MSTEQPHNHNDSVRFAETSNGNSPTVNVGAIPGELKGLDQWVCWRYEYVVGLEEPKKPPVDANTGWKCDPTDSSSWCDFETVVEYHESNTNTDGIGLVLTADDPYGGVDIDDCIDPGTGEINPEAEAIIAQFNSYTEISPSGEGIRILVIGDAPDGYSNRPGEFEVYDSDAYVTITGNHLESTPRTIERRDDELKEFCQEYLNEKSTGDTRTTGTTEIELLDGLDPNFVNETEEYLCRHFTAKAGDQVAEDIMVLLRGGTGRFDLSRPDNPDEIDRSQAELRTLQLLYGIYRHSFMYRDRAKDAAETIFTHYCNENPTGADGRPRKWLETDDAYRKSRLKAAIEHFDQRLWYRWQFTDRMDSDTINWYSCANHMHDGQPSPVTKQLTKAAVDLLAIPFFPTGDPDDDLSILIQWERVHQVDLSALIPYLSNNPPTTVYRCLEGGGLPSIHSGKIDTLRRGYPTARDIGFICRLLDRGYNRLSYYRKIPRLLQHEGQLKMAELEGYHKADRYVYYPPTIPDPDGARSVKCGGKEYET